MRSLFLAYTCQSTVGHRRVEFPFYPNYRTKRSGLKETGNSIIPSLLIQSVMDDGKYLAHESHDCRDFPNTQAMEVK